jgi:energy-coupling factor transporter ATP-binding protein EcfA2
VKVLYLELENFKGIYDGLGRKKIILNFEKNISSITILSGENGSGKSTILSMISPMPESFDQRKDLILENCEGYKNIVFQNKDDIYDIKHHYLKNGNKKCFISKNNIELNDNGSGWIYAVDKNHSIIMRGDRTGCVADFTNYYQYGGNLSTGKGHNFWTDGVLASQTIKMQIANNGICMTVPLYVCANGSAFGTAASIGQAMTIQAASNCRGIVFKNPAGGDGSLWLYGVSNSIDYSFSTYSVSNAFYLYNNGNYDFAGSDVSDIRLKENITTIDYNATEKLMQLVPKSYNMIKHPDTKRSGFIAQEVKEVLPDFVTGEETEKDYLGLDYNGLLAISIKAIQEQQCKIALLESCLGIA